MEHEQSGQALTLQQATFDSAFRWFELLFLTPDGKQETIRGSATRVKNSYELRRSDTYPDAKPPESSYSQYLLGKCSSEREARQRLGELLYLWARDAAMEEAVRRSLTSYLAQLDTDQQLLKADLLAWVDISSYELVPFDPVSVLDPSPTIEPDYSEAWVARARAATRADFRRGVLHLPTATAGFRCQCKVSMRLHRDFFSVVGTASYHVDHEIDPVTGKRCWLVVEGEDGACVGLSGLFQDLYNTEEEYNRYLFRQESE